MVVSPTASPGDFAVQVASSGGRYRLLLSGELDMAQAPALEARLRELSASGTAGVVVDLSRLKFMDSTGLRLMLLARELSEEHGCELVLIGGPAQVQRAFEISGLLDRLPFQEDGAIADGAVVSDGAGESGGIEAALPDSG